MFLCLRVTVRLLFDTMSLDTIIAVPYDTTRREIPRELLPMRPRRADGIAAGFSVIRPAVSKHTGLLTSLGLAQERTPGASRACAVRGQTDASSDRGASRSGEILGGRSGCLQKLRGTRISDSVAKIERANAIREDLRDEALRLATISTGVQSHRAQKSSWHRVRNAAG